MTVAAFQIVARKSRADGLVPRIRRCSKRFKVLVAANDQVGMIKVSKEAWTALTELFEILRNEQDQGRLGFGLMTVPTGSIVNKVSQIELSAMCSAKRIDRSHTRFGTMSLRDCLNKIAHHNTAFSDFRIDGRGAHYLVLGGKFNGHLWFAEILVASLCTNASRAVAAL